MIVEGVDGIAEAQDLFPGIGVGRGLFGESFGAIWQVEALFGETEAARFAGVEHFRRRQFLGEHLEIFKRHFRRVVIERHFIEPGPWIAQIRRVGMEGQIPVEVAAFTGTLREEFEEGATRAGLERILMTLGRPAVRH